MATSQHEGHANQLDLLIRAGNVSFRTHHLDPGASSDARAVFCSSPAAPRSAQQCAKVMEGNQEVITLVATCMALLHGLSNPCLRGEKLPQGSPRCTHGPSPARSVLCMRERVFVCAACSTITGCRAALHNQEVQTCCLSYVFATLSESEGHVGLFLLAYKKCDTHCRTSRLVLL